MSLQAVLLLDVLAEDKLAVGGRPPLAGIAASCKDLCPLVSWGQVLAAIYSQRSKLRKQQE